jgi:peptide/nickel transport system substrate-binding protein
VQSKWFTDATITCQVLPPDFPAYRPYCPYTLRPSSSGGWNAPDIATAQRLVRRSGTGGAVVRILSIPTWAPGLKPVVAAMNQIGYHARLVVTDNPTYFTYISDSRHKVQAAGSGWVADDVAASDFFVPLFTCNGFIPASPHNENETEFCDHSVDAAVHRALRLQASSSVAADALWATVDRRIVDAAPFIPLVNPSWVDVVSSRVENYERSPVIGVLFDQMWVY